MSKREPQIILKTDERSIHLEPEREGKFASKSSDWHETRVFLEGDKLWSRSRTAAGLLTPLPAGPRPAVELVRHHFPGD